MQYNPGDIVQQSGIYGQYSPTNIKENEVTCVKGERYQIGDVILEVSQPRKPCERLSLNSECKDTQRLVRETGLTGWYVRVIQGGICKKGDKIHRLQRAD